MNTLSRAMLHCLHGNSNLHEKCRSRQPNELARGLERAAVQRNSAGAIRTSHLPISHARHGLDPLTNDTSDAPAAWHGKSLRNCHWHFTTVYGHVPLTSVILAALTVVSRLLMLCLIPTHVIHTAKIVELAPQPINLWHHQVGERKIAFSFVACARLLLSAWLNPRTISSWRYMYIHRGLPGTVAHLGAKLPQLIVNS